MPYVFHPFHLAEQMDNEECVTVALLHDVVEDSNYTLNDLKRMGFSGEVIDAVALMTHDDNTPYMDYIIKLKTNPIARAVKPADLKYNSDLTRYDTLDQRTLERTAKYMSAIKDLSDD